MTNIKSLDSGIGRAVAERTILRKLSNDDNHVITPDEEKENKWHWETWGEVAERVALGNTLLTDNFLNSQPWIDKDWIDNHKSTEFPLIRDFIARGIMVTSGRHLQHGDISEPERSLEIFSNCSVCASSFTSFLLLMSGSGVGRCYDDKLILVDWEYAPNLRIVIDDRHPDYDYKIHESVKEAKHKYRSDQLLWHIVADSREGWAKALEVYEFAAFEKIHKDKILILDFSRVRAKNTPIKGMQNRPASGPVPLMEAFTKVTSLKGAGLKPWLQNMYVDHYMAECVLVGGSRRSSRAAVKYWKEPDVEDFIAVKKGGFLWSANNSVGVDKEFWELISKDQDPMNSLSLKAHRVFNLITEANWNDRTGEPGFLNVDKLNANNEGLSSYLDGEYVGSKKYTVNESTKIMLARIARRAKNHAYNYLVNPCYEIAISILGGYCVIGDLAPYHCQSLLEFESAARAMVRFLIRVNTLDCLYSRETTRTNRIGVSLIGMHEWFYKEFGFTWPDIINIDKSKKAWEVLSFISNAIKDEAEKYSSLVGVNVPHTCITIKPGGTVSKLWALTEGCHLPAMKEYIRWVQFINSDPLITKYKDLGYPTKELKVYKGTTIIGFPVQPELCRIMPTNDIICAHKATPEEQFTYLQLLEKYWLGTERANQISFTLKYDPMLMTFESFKDMIRTYMPTIKCCSLMPYLGENTLGVYEYLPENSVSKEEYIEIVKKIKKVDISEVIDYESLSCQNGSCPI